MKCLIEKTDEGFELTIDDGKTYVYPRLSQVLARIEKAVEAPVVAVAEGGAK